MFYRHWNLVSHLIYIHMNLLTKVSIVFPLLTHIHYSTTDFITSLMIAFTIFSTYIDVTITNFRIELSGAYFHALFDMLVSCNMKRTYKTSVWIIPQWHFVFINEDDMEVFPHSDASRWCYESGTDWGTSCLTHISDTRFCFGRVVSNG
jgi:hypothetical protein